LWSGGLGGEVGFMPPVAGPALCFGAPLAATDLFFSDERRKSFLLRSSGYLPTESPSRYCALGVVATPLADPSEFDAHLVDLPLMQRHVPP